MLLHPIIQRLQPPHKRSITQGQNASKAEVEKPCPRSWALNHCAIVRLAASFFLLSYLRFDKSVSNKFLVILIWKIILKAVVLRDVYLLTVIKIMLSISFACLACPVLPDTVFFKQLYWGITYITIKFTHFKCIIQ